MGPRARHRWLVPLAVVVLVLAGSADPGTQGARRLATIDALRHYPTYFHLQPVLVRGELAEAGLRPVLRTDEDEMRIVLDAGVTALTGPVEIRGQLVDVGRLDRRDPRLTRYFEGRIPDRWPLPGEELFIMVQAMAAAEPAVTPTVRAIALEPWKFERQRVTLTGNFRGRNLFGDLPDAPRHSRYDFVLRGAEGAVWVVGLRPRGRGFDLDIDRRLDTDQWLEVTGTVDRGRGLVTIAATELTLTTAPAATPIAPEVSPPAVPLRTAEVIFSSPVPGDVGVSRDTTVRLQFSHGLNDTSLEGRIQVRYAGTDTESPPAFTTGYDRGTRALEIRFARPLEPFRTVEVEILDGVEAFDGAPVEPWSLTFSVGN